MNFASSRSSGPSPVTSGVEYHRVLAGPKRRIGRGILAIALLLGGMFGAGALFVTIAAGVEGVLRPDDPAAMTMNSPLIVLAGLLGVAVMTPLSMAIQRWLYGVRGASLHSVLGRFRFDLFGRALVLIVPLFAIVMAIPEAIAPASSIAWARGDIIALFLMTVLIVPLQAAGEEYGFRGLIFRIAGSWSNHRVISLGLGIVVSSVAFAVAHVAPDPTWNVLFLVVSLSTAIVTWRTGGIEIAVLIHAVFNVFFFLFAIVPHADLAERFDRSAGAMGPEMFVPASLAMVLITAVVWIRTRRTGPATTPTEHVGT